MSDTTTPDADVPPAEDLLVPELDDDLRGVRDHLLARFPQLEAAAHRGELTLLTPAEALPEVLAFCKDDPDLACEMLSDVSAVHWPAGTTAETDQETTGWPTYTETVEQGTIEVSYVLRSLRHNRWLRLRVALDDEAPVVASATGLYSSASFLEREVYDLMGVQFTGHPNLVRIMMPEDWEGHPHRKDYPLGGVEVMYKGKTVPPPDERDY